jgi:hypothetical protein
MSVLDTVQAMNEMVDSCKCEEDFETIWDDFWELSSFVDDFVHIEYYDPDTSYEEDILYRMSAIKAYFKL